MESIPNPERGCGYLKPDQAYLRADPHPDGKLPPFVEFTPHIPFLEDHFRSYQLFNGVQFELSVQNHHTTLPEGEIFDHLERMTGSLSGDHAGDMDSYLAHDLLMHVGEKHYPTPQDFVDETRQYGLNKAIPTSTNNEPPTIWPGKTRLFLIHPQAAEGQGGIFGYAYLTRVIYTQTENERVPGYVNEWNDTDQVDVVKRGPEGGQDQQQEIDLKGGSS